MRALKQQTFLAVALLCIIEATNIYLDSGAGVPKPYAQWRYSQSNQGKQ